jgi:flagellar biogenesis protein FliO
MAMMVQAMGSLAIVVALVVLTAWAARWAKGVYGSNPMRGKPGQPELRLRATLALDPRRRLHLVDTEQGLLMVLSGGAQDQLLAWPPR